MFDRDQNLRSFDEMFARIRESYPHPAKLTGGPDGVDWGLLHQTLRPEVEAAQQMNEVREVMERALAYLGESHFAIIPRELYEGLFDRNGDVAESANPGSVGLRVRIVDGVPIVVSVEPGSSAADADIRAGWSIEKIGELDTRSGAAALRQSIGDNPLTRVRIGEWVDSQLILPVGERLRTSFRATDGTLHTRRLVSQKQPGLWASFGMLPAMNLRYTAKTLPGEIGYFSLSVFLDPPRVMPVFSTFIMDNQDARGIVLDLRGNPGGLGAMATGMCGFLIAEEGHRIGTMITREGRLQFVVNPRYPQFRGPVAILVDERSLSTSEILAGGLQDLGRARVFGQPTPGAALPSRIIRLPNGDALQYATADYVSASGRRLEGRGITPDVIVPLDRKALEAGRDAVLDAACQWILERSSATRPVQQ